MKKILKKLRYNFYISTVLKLTLVPIYKICAFINFRISRHILINSGTVEYDGYKLSFPKNLGVNYISSLFWNGDDGFEKDVWKTLKPLILKSNYFFDIGSNIGFYSVLAKKVNLNIKVAAFEPIESIYNKNLKFHCQTHTKASWCHRVKMKIIDAYIGFARQPGRIKIRDGVIVTI